MQTIIQKAQAKFLTMIDDFGSDPWQLRRHIFDAEKWAVRLIGRYPEADPEVLLLAVWLHDIGHYPIPEEDHAVVSERIARKFLEKEHYNAEKLINVLHCIRSHRNKDVVPETLEAVLDSASHFTYGPYVEMICDNRADQALEKLNRDYRDLELFPEIKKELEPLYLTWAKLIKQLTDL